MKSPKVAVVWRGDREARRNATPANNRFHRVFEELAAVGIHAEPAVYDEEFANEPQLRISLKMFAVEGDGRLSGSEGISDEAGENMGHGVHGRPVA